MKYSIVIGTLNHLNDLLKPCIESIIKYTDLSTCEVIVVANGCTDGTAEYVRSLGYPFRLLEHSEPLGFAGAYNAGMMQSIGKYIVLLNNDTILLPQNKNEWLEKLETPFIYDDKVAVTGPLKSYCPHAEREFLIFFCAMISVKHAQNIGLLSTEFGVGGGEDTDYCIRAENEGYKVVSISDPIEQNGLMVGNFPIYHKGEATVSENPQWNDIFKENSNKLAQKYKLPDGWFSPDDIKEYRRLVEMLPDWAKICELGTWKGRSLCSIADIINRKNLTVFVVDTFQGTENEGDKHIYAKQNDLLEEFKANINRFNLKVNIIQSTTNEAAKMDLPLFDLVFIDADHSYEAVKQDIKNWSLTSLILCGHDFGSWEGVTKAVKESCEVYHVGGNVWSKY